MTWLGFATTLPRSNCAHRIWSEGGYRVPGLEGLYCPLVCVERAIAVKTDNTKKIPGLPIGNGARLLAYLRTEVPALYRKLPDQLGHQGIRVTERHYAPWVRSRQEQLEADLERAWSQDALLLLETNATPALHGKDRLQ